jgi:crossover junction endodeoxyribonuclease RuvC
MGEDLESIKQKLKEFGLDKSYSNSSHIIAGIDPSLQKTGIIIMNSSGKVIHEELIKPKKLKSIARLKMIKDRLIHLLKVHKVTVVAIEGYSFGSRGRATFSLGELGGVLRLSLLENNFKFFDVSPSSLKSFVAENGAADKVMMRQAVIRKYRLDISEDNICDAYGLARMCLFLGDSMPKFCAKGGAQLMKKLREKHKIILQ